MFSPVQWRLVHSLISSEFGFRGSASPATAVPGDQGERVPYPGETKHLPRCCMARGCTKQRACCRDRDVRRDFPCSSWLFGSGRLHPASAAWICRQTEEEIDVCSE